MNAVIAIVMVMGLIFGGGGVTVSAAQSSMPDDALYAVKLATEQVRMQLAGDAEAGFQLALQFADRRMEEAMYLLGNGEIPDEALLNRIQTQNENCLKLALGLQEDQVIPALTMLQEQFRQQLQRMEQVNLPEDAKMEQVRLQLRTQLEQQLRLAQLGETDPVKLKEELRTREQQRLEQQENDAPRKEEQNQYQNPEGSGSGGQNGSQWQGESPTQASGDGSGDSQNPWTTDTPTPGSGYGPGESQNPWTTETPTPGSGYGPGSGTCTTCTPQYGTPGGSGGNQP